MLQAVQSVPKVVVDEHEEVIGRACYLPSQAAVSLQAEAGTAVRGRTGVARGESIVLHAVSVQVGTTVILDDADIRLKAGSRYGLVAKNGEGKSVVLKLLATGAMPHIQEHINTVYVQREARASDQSLVDFVMQGACQLQAWRQHVDRLERAVADLAGGQSPGGTSPDVQLATDSNLPPAEIAPTADKTDGSAAPMPPGSPYAFTSVEEAVEALGEAQTKLEEMQGHSARARARNCLRQCGFPDAQHSRTTRELSGGWRMRCSVARALFAEPDILFLDEIETFADLPTLLWLQGFLQQVGHAAASASEEAPGAGAATGGAASAGMAADLQATTAVIVSHNRAFLDAVTTDTIHLHRKKLRPCPGSYSVFVKAREDLATKEAHLFEKQEKRRGKLKQSVENVKKQVKRAGDHRMSAGQVRNLKKKLEHSGVQKTADGKRWKLSYMCERREATIEPPEPKVHFQMQSAAPISKGTTVMQLEGASFAYGTRVVGSSEAASASPSASADASDSHPWVIEEATAAVRAGDRIAIVGANGHGKSTLVRLLLGELSPQRGSHARLGTARVRHFAQHSLDDLDGSKTAFEHFMGSIDGSGLSDRDARAQLGKFGLRGEAADRPMATLSGGQRSRVALAVLSFEPSHVLVLDEPLHYLDIDTTEGLVDALQSYDGTVVLVSHDLSFLQDVCPQDGPSTRVWTVKDGRVMESTTLETYLGSLGSSFKQATGQAGADAVGLAGAAAGLLTLEAAKEQASPSPDAVASAIAAETNSIDAVREASSKPAVAAASAEGSVRGSAGGASLEWGGLGLEGAFEDGSTIETDAVSGGDAAASAPGIQRLGGAPRTAAPLPDSKLPSSRKGPGAPRAADSADAKLADPASAAAAAPKGPWGTAGAAVAVGGKDRGGGRGRGGRKVPKRMRAKARTAGKAGGSPEWR